LDKKADTTAPEAERLGLTTATFDTLRTARLGTDLAKSEEVEIMPRNNPDGKPD
jgi:hypothetical protein